MALFYGIKTANEGVWNGASPFHMEKLVIVACVPILVAVCLLVIGIPTFPNRTVVRAFIPAANAHLLRYRSSDEHVET